jgi:hypothetical protein
MRKKRSPTEAAQPAIKRCNQVDRYRDHEFAGCQDLLQIDQENWMSV